MPSISITASLACIAFVLMHDPAHAQQREMYDPRTGKSTGHTVTDSEGVTTVYDEHGRVIRRSTQDKDGSGTVYGPDGRKMLTITPKQERR